MIAIKEQLAFAKAQVPRLRGTSPESVALMSAIVATLERQQMLFEVSEEMKSKWRKTHPSKKCPMCGQEIDEHCADCDVMII
jgi:hypothetical protein